jgi:hypothetical protein
LRTLTKAGGPVENVLMTPFTELAVQRASAASGGGNLTLVGFQTQIGALETGLGITGLANGKPFGGTSEADQKYLAALTAFSKQQQGSGKSVGDLLSIMGGQIDKCGISSAGATLTAYGNVSVSSKGGGIQLASFSTPSTAEPLPNKFSAYNINMDAVLPEPCVDNLIIDGIAANFADLASSPKPVNWSTSTKVELTVCSASKVGLQADFPLATLNIHAPANWSDLNLIANPGTLNIDTGGFGTISPGGTVAAGATISNLPGLPPFSASKLNLFLGINGCLLPSISSAGGDTTVVNSTIGAGSGGGTMGAGGNIIISGGTTGSGGGSIMISGGGLTTNGSGGSGSGGITLTGSK